MDEAPYCRQNHGPNTLLVFHETQTIVGTDLRGRDSVTLTAVTFILSTCKRIFDNRGHPTIKLESAVELVRTGKLPRSWSGCCSEQTHNLETNEETCAHHGSCRA